MNQDTNRLLMELERSMRSINRDIINPQLEALSLSGLKPVLTCVATARARYLKTLFEISAHAKGGALDEAQIAQLTKHRRDYDELVNAAKALEVAIQRGYLDVSTGNR